MPGEVRELRRLAVGEPVQVEPVGSLPRIEAHEGDALPVRRRDEVGLLPLQELDGGHVPPLEGNRGQVVVEEEGRGGIRIRSLRFPGRAGRIETIVEDNWLLWQRVSYNNHD